MYNERELTRNERDLAYKIRNSFDDHFVRLQVASEVAGIAEDTRDRAWAYLDGHSQQAWDSMHFPRYKFFAEAVDPMWDQFSRSV